MLTNILFAFRTKRPSDERLRDLFAAVIAQWTRDGGRRADSIIEQIADNPPDSAITLEPRAQVTSCSRVVDALSLVTYNIDHRQLGFGVTDEVPPALLELLETGIPDCVALNEIRGRRPLAWITSTERLEELRARHTDPDELATVVRDQLGLSHYDHDQLLLELDYPEEVSATLEHAAPTFLEGGPSLIFRAALGHDAWGRAVDLTTLQDGLPEAVHRPIAFTARFRIRRIGRPRTDPGFEFQKVVEGAQYPWTGMPDDFLDFVSVLSMAEPE